MIFQSKIHKINYLHKQNKELWAKLNRLIVTIQQNDQEILRLCRTDDPGSMNDAEVFDL